MDPSQIALFDLADQRLAWTARRQAVLAQNLANADTPGWRERDLKPFAASLKGAAADLPIAVTDPMHIAASGAGPPHGEVANGERAPDGNAVPVDAELVKIAETDTEHALVTDLYKKYLGLFRTALGR